MTTTSLLLGIITLSLATYAFRIGGVLLGSKTTLSPESADTLNLGSVMLLLSVAVTSALYQGTELDGIARPLGVLAAVVCAIFRLPIIVTVLAAAVVTAALRLFGLP